MKQPWVKLHPIFYDGPIYFLCFQATTVLFCVKMPSCNNFSLEVTDACMFFSASNPEFGKQISKKGFCDQTDFWLARKPQKIGKDQIDVSLSSWKQIFVEFYISIL